ncbi:MAG: efflux RND transporter periplasmic adaptor subunit [Segetibacter sp.]
MNLKHSNTLSGSFWSYKLLLLFVAIASVLSFTSCKHDKKVAANKDVYYTCSMHPQVNEPKPGKCPICGMTLIQVQKSNAPKSDELLLSEQQIQLGNIVVDTIGKGIIGNETVLTATLNYDQQKLTAVSSRVMGRIDKLYHKNIGDYIRKGEPLIEVYSEELNNSKQEYLLALERRKVLDNSLIDFDQVIKSAKTKLMLWGMSEGQINALTNNNKAKLTTTAYSNESGYITELNVQEGEYISEGGTILQLADLSTLWAEAQIYTSQYSQINNNGTVTVKLPDIGKEIRGKLEFVNPEISPNKRINLIRVTIPNQGNQLKPGMPAYVIVKGAQRNVLSLPMDAVLRDANGATVWVQTGKNTFKNRMVTVGMESDDRIEITGGLNANDVVVTSGAYLINSEYIFRRGSSPMAGMKM